MQEALPGFARKALAAGVLGLGALAGAHSLSNHDAVASTGAMPQHSYTQQAEPMTNVDPDIVNGHHRNYPIELTYMQGGELPPGWLWHDGKDQGSPG